MKNLKIIAERSLDGSVFDLKNWEGYKVGLYKVTEIRQNEKNRKHLVYYGEDHFGNVLPFGIPFPYDSEFEDEPKWIEAPTVVQLDQSSISGDTLLKAIAIAQNPELAIQLLTK